MTFSIDEYLQDKFPTLKLESPLFYNAAIGLRFEIGNPDPSVSDEKYREQVRFRSTELFKNTHNDNDDIYIVLYLYLNRKHGKTHKLNVFRKGVKNKRVLRNLSCESIVHSDEEDEDWESYRYVLKCKVSDIKSLTFLFADYSLFFINTTNHTIFYFYDSRGLDIVSNSKEALQETFLKYNHWILDYDREKMNSVFLSKNYIS
ncbi:hypothetical protein Back11_33970 [Paenibacillus baekrokdamisoli]|uniref:DUF3885 domain-containing protein n=1 Tax=Paenibacillus baekrokdamisoli TaxID=1712516 RepID=A0A3G9IV10_9BACL|nr:DUF3885 domain-containing protein [Paenibacillus baekrokdamisoli]MBB3073379.1 hypothetical protein [Paenibacillus baekrokdamisoli]BBH22052.1 hypothetical protein Back11_33970 [Paenibacillus baekrokdamisoli]